MIKLDILSRSRTKKIQLQLPVLLGIQLHPKTSESLRLRLRLHNPGCYSIKKVAAPAINCFSGKSFVCFTDIINIINAFEQNKFFWNGWYAVIETKQVGRDLKKVDNHWRRVLDGT